jgi:hypothetical protein
MKIYIPAIRPTVTCGVEIWTLTERDINCLMILEGKPLRKIFIPHSITILMEDQD